MSKLKFWGLSRVHLYGIALAGLFALILLVEPSRSQAAEEPFNIEFDQSAMQFGLLSDLPLGELATTGSLEGTIDETGKITMTGTGQELLHDDNVRKAYLGG